MNTRRILLNCCPPAYPDTPNASVSVLKNFLNSYGYEVDIKYWNVELYDIIQEFFPWETIEGTTRFLLPFLYREAMLRNNEEDKRNIYEYYRNLSSLALSETDFFSKVLLFEKEIHKRVSRILINDYALIGFSYKLFQIFSVGTIIDEIKIQKPESVIVIGGADDRKSAQAILRNYPSADYVTWGEGEYPLLKLLLYLENQITFEEVVNFAYRENGEILVTRTNKEYVNLNEIVPDYSDFFKVNKASEAKLPIEGSRSCKWGKCRFCCFNAGYKYRLKDVDRIIEELKYQISKYGSHTFHFTDNAINNLDNVRFNLLLDSLIDLKAEYPLISFYMAEVMSKGLNQSIIKKLWLSGFTRIQIGYESLSDNLLSKIKKINTVSSNILFVKWAQEYGISVVGSNIIKNLLEETNEDINESIKNLYYLRFFLGKNGFRHRLVLLSVNHLSKYYKELNKSRFLNWHCQDVLGYNPSSYLQGNDDLILYGYIKEKYNELWDEFQSKELSIISKNYSYKLSYDSELSSICYEEFSNGEIEINYTITEKEWELLKYCNNQVRTATEMESLYPHYDVNECLKKLSSIGLLYKSSCNDDCVTIINTDKIHESA